MDQYGDLRVDVEHVVVFRLSKGLHVAVRVAHVGTLSAATSIEVHVDVGEANPSKLVRVDLGGPARVP